MRCFDAIFINVHILFTKSVFLHLSPYGEKQAFCQGVFEVFLKFFSKYFFEASLYTEKSGF